MAVQWIGSLSDAELLDYLPQLVQVGGLTYWSCNDPTCKTHVSLHSVFSMKGRGSGRYRLQAVNTASPSLSLKQALKYECYLDSPLVRFLLKRAVSDLRVTHYFFW